MTSTVYQEALNAYAMFAAALCVLLICIDAFGGVLRTQSKSTPNAEDLGTLAVGKDAVVKESDPGGVARVMRAHRNALSSIVPFLIVMLIYVLLGASERWVVALCGVFTTVRVIHAFVYLRGLQYLSLRTLSFVIGQLCIAIAAIQVFRIALLSGM